MLNLIVACLKDYGIGYKNDLPWGKGEFKEDMAYFKEKTTGKMVVMGHNTFESLNRPEGLPNRLNIVVTAKHIPSTENVRYMNYTRFLQYLSANPDKEFWCIGGAQLYRQMMSLCDELHITKIDADYPCDTFLEPSRGFDRLFNLGEKKTLSEKAIVWIYKRK